MLLDPAIRRGCAGVALASVARQQLHAAQAARVHAPAHPLPPSFSLPAVSSWQAPPSPPRASSSSTRSSTRCGPAQSACRCVALHFRGCPPPPPPPLVCVPPPLPVFVPCLVRALATSRPRLAAQQPCCMPHFCPPSSNAAHLVPSPPRAAPRRAWKACCPPPPAEPPTSAAPLLPAGATRTRRPSAAPPPSSSAAASGRRRARGRASAGCRPRGRPGSGCTSRRSWCSRRAWRWEARRLVSGELTRGPAGSG